MSLAKWIGFGAGLTTTNGQSSAGVSAAGNVKTAAVSKAENKQFGYENFGNTCYVNSVLQALYFCHPFRELVIQAPDRSNPLVPVNHVTVPPPAAESANPRIKNVRKPSSPEVRTLSNGAGANGASPPTGPVIPAAPPTLFSALRALFVHISNNSVDKGTISPRAFVDKLKKENELFRSSMHQDAHEFLNYLLNKIAEDVEEEARNSRSHNSSGEDLSSSVTSSGPSTLGTVPSSSHSNSHTTFVHDLFEGILTSETRCLTCETVSSRDEAFIDLSIDIEQNSSVTACLRQFSASEMLCQRNKFFCDSCCGLQEAEKRMKIKRLPNVLALHLKRFKYQEDVQKYIKLTYRVAFPLELRLFNTVDDAQDPDRLYELFAIVVHIGNGPHHGHYVAIVKSRGTWVIFDDDTVDTIKESDIPKYFGDSNSGCAYVLYYQAVDLDLAALGLKTNDLPASDSVPASPPLPAPLLPPGLTHEGDSDASEHAPTTPASPAAAIIVPSSPPALTVTIPPEPSPPLPVSHTTPTAASPSAKSGGGFFGLRHSPSKPSIGSVNRTSIYSSTAPPVPPIPPIPTSSPRLQDGPSEASTSTSSTVPVVNGKIKSPKEKSSGWFKRRSIRPEKAEKPPETPPRPATSYEPNERNDGSSVTSSASSSRVPPISDPLSNLRIFNPPARSETITSEGSSSLGSKSPQVGANVLRSSTLPPTAYPPSPTLPSSSNHRLSAHLHFPGHKKSYPALSSSPISSTKSKPSGSISKRPSTAGAAMSSPTRDTFVSSEDATPLPPLPTHLRSTPPENPSLPADELPRREAIHRRNSSHIESQPVTGKRPSRKMSFTGGMLGFGRKDKDKDKHKDRDTPRTLPPPSSSNGASLVPGMSMIGRL